MKNNKRLGFTILGIVVFAILTIIAYTACKKQGIINDHIIRRFIRDAGAYGILAYIGLYVLINSFFCFVPGTDVAFIGIAMYLYGITTKCFLICLAATIATSLFMDFLGRVGGHRLVKKMVGEEDYEKALHLMKTKGAIYVPIFYTLPCFPDNAICMVSGALKVNWFVHLIEIVLCRGIGLATIVFGVSVLPKELMDNIKNFYYVKNHFFDYLTVLTVIVFWVVALFAVARKVDKALTKRIENKNK